MAAPATTAAWPGMVALGVALKTGTADAVDFIKIHKYKLIKPEESINLEKFRNYLSNLAVKYRFRNNI